MFYLLTYLLTYLPVAGACNEDVTVTDYGVFYWPRTTHSRRTELACPYGGLSSAAAAAGTTVGAATAYRWCNVSDNNVVEWMPPVYDDCSTVSYGLCPTHNIFV